jgi:hypothetical protein
MDQGQFGTCVANAFATTLTNGMFWKYGIPCDPNVIVSKIEHLVANGGHTDRMPKYWNEKQKEYSFKNMNGSMSYTVKIDFCRVSTFEAAFVEMERHETKKMYMPCAMSTTADGHSRHSVALVSALKTDTGHKTMQAQNSWGPIKTFLTVNEDNFHYAITFDPIITDAHKGATPIRPLPEPHCDYLQRQNTHLRAGQITADAQAKADRITTAALADADRIKTAARADAQRSAGAAQTEAQRITAYAREVLAESQRASQARAHIVALRAQAEAQRIIADADAQKFASSFTSPVFFLIFFCVMK